MYYPVQIPYILGKSFAEAIKYTEEIFYDFQDFVICFWEMQPVTNDEKTVENIIIADGCIDLVFDYQQKQLGFSGMTETEFNFKLNLPSYFMGARLKPGAFHAITNIPAYKAMNTFIPITQTDKNFNTDIFFNLPYNEAKKHFKNYIGELVNKKPKNEYMSLFDELSVKLPDTVQEIYQKLHYSPRQCQRIFMKNYGYTPKFALCILRFQKCLDVLTSGKATPCEIINMVNYYDQSHLINDFKRHIGLTPFELVREYL